MLVDKLLALLGANEEMVEYVEDRLGHDRRYSVDIAKITALGWRKQRTLDEALEETVDWYRANEWWWRPLKQPMRILVTGAGGQVGRELVELCERSGDDVIAADHGGLDVVDRDLGPADVRRDRPDVVVHAGAWTAVDACESDPDRAMAVNAIGSRHVAEAARRVGAHLVYVSTDYVFDGTKPAPYDEWDVPNPRRSTGRSKRAGEEEILSHAAGGAAVVRISWVCGRYGNNMVKTLLRLAANDARRRSS